MKIETKRFYCKQCGCDRLCQRVANELGSGLGCLCLILAIPTLGLSLLLMPIAGLLNMKPNAYLCPVCGKKH